MKDKKGEKYSSSHIIEFTDRSRQLKKIVNIKCNTATEIYVCVWYVYYNKCIINIFIGKKQIINCNTDTIYRVHFRP